MLLKAKRLTTRPFHCKLLARSHKESGKPNAGYNSQIGANGICSDFHEAIKATIIQP
jgi:hypothetical protein